MDSVYCTRIVELALKNDMEHHLYIMRALRNEDLNHMEVEELISDYVFDMITIDADTNLLLHDLLMASYYNVDWELIADTFISKHENEMADKHA